MAGSSFRETTSRFFKRLWRWYAGLARWAQVALIVVIVVILGAILVLARGGSSAGEETQKPTVTLESIDDFGANSNGVDVLGTVQSISEADILAQSSGEVTAVNTTVGANVPAGFVIASLDGSAQAATVLQAQGAYDAAVAESNATTLQAQNTEGSLPQAQTTARNLYQSTYTTLSSVITDDVDQLFGNNTPVGPMLLLNPLGTGNTLPEERRNIDTLMANWDASLASADSTDPLTLLSSAQASLTTVASFLNDLNNLAGQQGSGATSAQLAALATAQSSVNTLLAGINSEETTYNAAVTSAEVSQTESADSTGSGVTTAQATVEEALGALRAAQAAFEKTVIRAPIAGTVNYLPITVGEYVNANQHVATVARNNALEVVLELSQDDANRLAVGDTLTIDNTDSGVVTTIAPALDPTTEQIEVDVAVNDGSDLVDGESVQVALPALPASAAAAVATSTASVSGVATASTTPAIELPLTAVKLLPDERDIFTVSNGRLVAHQVQIGEVVGDRIQILTPLAGNMEIVTDTRGLSAGDAVTVSTTTPATDDDDSGD